MLHGQESMCLDHQVRRCQVRQTIVPLVPRSLVKNLLSKLHADVLADRVTWGEEIRSG